MGGIVRGQQLHAEGMAKLNHRLTTRKPGRDVTLLVSGMHLSPLLQGGIMHRLRVERVAATREPKAALTR